MKVSGPASCLLLLTFGACFPLDEGQELRYPGEEWEVMGELPGLWVPEGSKRKHSPEDLESLLSMARELQGSEKERAGIRFRFGREEGGPEEESEAVNYLPEEAGEKRGGTLGSLAEELNGYSRKKGGFSFRFGRRRATLF
ncbi:orexigenic neuropeptide QRFP [Rhineura floridana]|uniref:orexigenic neuropeptide QRFP n=1 Tax=Rhineura floridana TaxID=261503 RepID=UPI002AC80CB2|nr:orexigenic neuropeptide QRFP [Rhineura floridana]